MPIEKVIAIYPGRFQPMCLHHYKTFEWLQSKFGVDNCYITTSDKVEYPDNPLSFSEKKAIMSKYGIGNRVVESKSPYTAKELMSYFNPKTTAIVILVGEKDLDRLSTKNKKDGSPSYYQYYRPDMPLESFMDRGYILVAPNLNISVKNYGNMSGTVARKALSTAQKHEHPALFKELFGWYDPYISDLLKKKFNKEESTVFNILENCLKKSILVEMAAPGHMAHVFDIPTVRKGGDLLNVFLNTAEYLKNNTVPVKIDGINLTLRLVTISGKRQFVIDRGSNKPLDVKGVTTSDLESRFGQGHNMVAIGLKVLNIFNTALPWISEELNELGLWSNSNLMINLEYVEGKTNVQEYNNNFLSIHGVLKIAQTSPTKRDTEEVLYSKEALNRLISKLNPIAKYQGFTVEGNLTANLFKTPDFDLELLNKYTIRESNNKTYKVSLKELLDHLLIPKEDTIKLLNGKTVKALSKEVFINILNEVPLSSFIQNYSDYPKAINGFVTYLATMRLGYALLNCMKCPLGVVSNQEGIVVRDYKVYDKPYKITGSFILRGMDSPFKK